MHNVDIQHVGKVERRENKVEKERLHKYVLSDLRLVGCTGQGSDPPQHKGHDTADTVCDGAGDNQDGQLSDLVFESDEFIVCPLDHTIDQSICAKLQHTDQNQD